MSRTFADHRSRTQPRRTVLRAIPTHPRTPTTVRTVRAADAGRACAMRRDSEREPVEPLAAARGEWSRGFLQGPCSAPSVPESRRQRPRWRDDRIISPPGPFLRWWPGATRPVLANRVRSSGALHSVRRGAPADTRPATHSSWTAAPKVRSAPVEAGPSAGVRPALARPRWCPALSSIRPQSTPPAPLRP